MSLTTQPWLLSEKGILGVDGQPMDTPFGDAKVTAGDVRDGTVAVIVNDHDIWTSQDGTWENAASSEMILNCVLWTMDGRLLVGTERARLGWVEKGNVEMIPGFDAIPERSLWKTPWGGPPDTRSLAVASDGTLYANLHVGWIARSRDGGTTWDNRRDGLEMDVHEVAAHSTEPGVVFAATARGFHISADHGESFQQQMHSMPYHYQRACACFSDRNVYLTSTSQGPHGAARAQLYRTEDAGNTWSQVEGLPEEINGNIDTFQVAAMADGQGLVVVEDTALYETQDWGVHWALIGDEYPSVSAILV